MTWTLWEKAWHQALYGPQGFYRRPEGPAGHFRTAAHAAPGELAAALYRLAAEQECRAVVDVGAGRGELLTALDAHPGPAGDRLDLWGVDVVPRPAGLPPGIGWSTGSAALPDRVLAGALVVCWELLDVVPGPILEYDEAGELREVLVEPATGREMLGAPAAPDDRAWCEQWWPAETPDAEPDHRDPDDHRSGDRVEVGRTRDRFWADLVARSRRSGARALLAVDYAHRRGDRPTAGSLTGFRSGRAVPPRPDGSMDLPVHVAMDAVAAAGRTAGANGSELTDQHQALRALGVHDQDLLDPGGLGGFTWLLQQV